VERVVSGLALSELVLLGPTLLGPGASWRVRQQRGLD